MRVGRLEATGGFFLLLAWLNYLDRQFMLPMAAAACVLHELGHYAAIRLMGRDIKLIRLTAVGAEMVVAGPLSYWQEGLAALAGPAVNLVLALIFCSWPWAVGFAGLNLVLAAFNLIPVGPLDGGRALNCTLSLLVGPERSERVMGWMGLVCTVCSILAGLLLAGQGAGLTLLLTAAWLGGALFKQNRQNYGKRACQRLGKPVQ